MMANLNELDQNGQLKLPTLESSGGSFSDMQEMKLDELLLQSAADNGRQGIVLICSTGNDQSRMLIRDIAPNIDKQNLIRWLNVYGGQPIGYVFASKFELSNIEAPLVNQS